jgi:NAD(P)H-hydrate epimerase
MALNFNFESLGIRLPQRNKNAHKGSHGKVLVIAGSEGMGGAGILASEASLYCGSGLVTLFTHKSNVEASLVRNPEIMALGIQDRIESPDNINVFLIGPGFTNDKWSEIAYKCLSTNTKNAYLIFDAGALYFLSEPKKINVSKGAILTPHPGEAAKLLNTAIENIQANRESSAKKIAIKYDAEAVILKGHNTVVYIKNTDKTFLCKDGGPELASAGTGDVLAGILSALLAQGLSIKDACLLAVAVHSKAGINFREEVGEIGLNASALIMLSRKMLNQ